jgi:hypothetical protein
MACQGRTDNRVENQQEKMKTMKNSWLIRAGIMGAVIGFGAVVQANPIVGNIDMTGTASLNGSLGTATEIINYSGSATVTSASGAYQHLAIGTLVNWNTISWNPANTPVELWSFTSGFWTYSFDAISMTVVSQSNDALELSGAGVVKITGIGSPYLATLTTWTLAITPGQDGGYSFNFDPPSAPTPDDGATGLLLGIALLGLGLVHKKLFSIKRQTVLA